ncbi:MAG: hypothetical protein SH856_01790 [Flavobacteriales bacterium]|nr:hypothetical protein [Flavobacteriales bacterium]
MPEFALDDVPLLDGFATEGECACFETEGLLIIVLDGDDFETPELVPAFGIVFPEVVFWASIPVLINSISAEISERLRRKFFFMINLVLRLPFGSEGLNESSANSTKTKPPNYFRAPKKI